MKMKKSKFKIHIKGEGFQTVTGLVSKHLGLHNAGDKNDPLYHVTHLPSGYRIMSNGLGYRQCREFIRRLEVSDLPLDDTQKLAQPHHGDKVNEIRLAVLAQNLSENQI